MNTKGSGVALIREWAQKNGIEQKLAEQLTPDEEKLFKSVLSISWVPETFEVKVTKLYADLIMPHDPDRYLKIPNQIAKSQINRIFKILLRVFTVPRVIEKATSLWNTLNDQGSMFAFQTKNKNEINLILEDCQDLSSDGRMLYCGYIQGVLELTGAKNVQVSHIGTDPSAWKWIIRWD